MVNEIVDISAHILDFNLDSSARSADSQVQRSCSGSFTAQKSQPQQQQQLSDCLPQKDLLSVSLNSHLLPPPPSSAENLSWQFFEHVSSLDNQLRSDESSASVIRANGCHLMTTAATATASSSSATLSDASAVTAVDGQQRQQQTEIIARKSNGFANVANTTVDHLSQQSPLLIQQQQQQQLLQQQQQNVIFKFTSPTSTFKRKKQQQQQQQLSQQQISSNNNSNNYNNNQQRNISAATIRNQLQAPYEHHQSPATSPQLINTNHCQSTPRHPQQQHQQLQQQQQKSLQRNDPPTMINAGAGVVINSNTVGAGAAAGIASAATGTTPKTPRTLPAISKTPMQAYAEGVDLVGDTKAASFSSRNTRQRQHAHRMGGSGSGSGKSSFVDGIELHLGLIGWRKKCLYTLLALLMLLIITNLVLTLWILKVMEFSTDGMGPLKIVSGGVQLTGQAIIMDMLRASTIRSRHGQPIAIESSRNFSINTRDTNGMLENHLFLGHDKLECLSTGFRINNTDGKNIFSVNRNEVTIGAHALRIDGEGGAIFRESVQTPHVRAEPGRELRLESPTRQLELTAARDINLVSRAGSIEISALDDVKLSALDGSLRLESTTILMPNLRTAQPPIPGTAQSRDHLHRVFQLCACSNGKLFLAAPHSICAGDDTTVCR